MARVGETRVDLQHLLEDLRDADVWRRRLCEVLASDEWFAISDHPPIVADFQQLSPLDTLHQQNDP